MPGTKPILDYLFEADLGNGETYHQGADDQSVLFPMDEHGNGKSAFADVLALDRLHGLLRFHLIQGESRATVDLQDGHFEINGVSFWVHDLNVPITTSLRLIYFRNVTVSKTTNSQGEVIDLKHHYTSHNIGWQTTTKEGRNIQHVIAVT